MKQLFSILLCGAMIVSFNACNTNEPDESGNGSNNNGSGNIVQIGPKEPVDLGLPSGTLWATCNVGAAKPEEYGDYFAWGETKPKASYGWFIEGDYKWGVYDDEDSNYGMTKYNPMDNNNILDTTDDAATVNWGKNWRIPTAKELSELRNSCTWKWTSDYNSTGVAGYVVSSKTEGNTNSIFLPAAGYRNGTELDNAGVYGYYWSASIKTNSQDAYALVPYQLYFTKNKYYYVDCYNYRFLGCAVRPIYSPQ